MNAQLTALWTLGLMITVGSMLRVDPFPWIWLGLAILLHSMRLICKEIKQIKSKSTRMEAVAISLIKRGELAGSPRRQTPSSAACGPAEDAGYNPYGRASQSLSSAASGV